VTYMLLLNCAIKLVEETILFGLHVGTGCEPGQPPLKWVPDVFPGDKAAGA